jgi:TolA-binding protein
MCRKLHIAAKRFRYTTQASQKHSHLPDHTASLDIRAYNFPMALSRRIAVVLLAFASALAAQQPAPPQDTAPQSSSSKAAPVQNDQQPPASQTPDTTADKKKESKLKRKLKDAAPNCIGFGGGAGKCRHSQESDEERKQEAADEQLRHQCRDTKDAGNPEDQPCADLRKSDAQHDVSVGDDYFGDKHYPSAENRYRLALQEDPTNATAMFHLAQVLEKTGRNSDAYQQYQNFLNTEPVGPDAKRAREALTRLRPYWTGTPSQ